MNTQQSIGGGNQNMMQMHGNMNQMPQQRQIMRQMSQQPQYTGHMQQQQNPNSFAPNMRRGGNMGYNQQQQHYQ